jgi:flagellar motor switch protein FliN/FliY
MINDDPSDIAEFLTGTFVKISFKMQVGDLVDSTLMQLYPIEFAKALKDTVITGDATASEPEPAPAPAPAPAPEPMPQAAPSPMPTMDPSMMAAGPMPQMAMPQMAMPQMQMPPQMMNMNIQPAQFQTFAGGTTIMAGGENIGIIKDVPLEVTVELGRTAKPIADILDFAPGTIIELDKVAGEPVDVLVNGKFVAKGEVVVIEESFGVRVTEIVQ